MDYFGAATDMNLRKELEEKLLTDHKVWMWSYDVSRMASVGVADRTLVEKYLHFGKDQDWHKLKEGYPFILEQIHHQDHSNCWIIQYLLIHLTHQVEVKIALNLTSDLGF